MGTQPHLVIYVLSMAVFSTMAESRGPDWDDMTQKA